MDDIVNKGPANQGNFDPNRPRLKKVKRPVKKLVSSPNGIPVPPRAPGAPSYPSKPVPTPESGADFNLDEFLDGSKSNVPSITKGMEVFNNESDFTPQFIDENDIAETAPSFKESLVSGNMYSAKALVLAALAMFIVGFGFAKLFFAEETVIRDGLQGVVINPEVPRGRARCGVAERTQGCVLYIMNPQRQELNARDFYDLASQLTGRQRFVIETGNMRYSNVKIRPGNIAQLNIPPLQ